MRKVLSTAALFLCTLTTFAQFSGSGAGTASDPYKIFYADQLNQVRNFTNQSGVVFKLMSDIDLTAWMTANNPGQGWEPVGVTASPFKGVFDGNGKKITGFTINRPSTDYVGLFGCADGATIKDLTIEGDVKGGSYTGAFVGSGSSTLSGLTYRGDVSGSSNTGGIVGNCSSSISNVIVVGNVTGSQYVGGIAGKSLSTLNSASYTGDVTGSSYAGGISGHGSTINNSSSNGTIEGSDCVGGISGESSTISNCSSMGVVRGHDKVGGITGSSYGTITACYSYNDVIGNGNYIGGVIGSADGTSFTITKCFSYGDVSGAGYVGGIIGSHKITSNNGTLSNCYAIGTISSSDSNIGGIAGCLVGELSDSYYTGDLSGSNNVGGIVGQMQNGSIVRNYSNATIAGAKNVGGIVGIIVGSTVKSNMSLNKEIRATSSAGRIYGSKGSSVTIGTNGTSEDNRALSDTRVIVSGVTQEIEDNEQNGVNNGAAYFKLKGNYVSHGWDFNNNWANLETETYPYKPWQAAPPTITSALVSGDNSISGRSMDGGTVYIKIGSRAIQSVSCSGTSFTITGFGTLKSGEPVSLYAKAAGKETSYINQFTVGYPGSGTEADPWRVYTADDIQGVYKSGYYKQMNDIDLTSWISANSTTAGWKPVGYSGSGAIVYDGNNHKVTGLWTNTSDDYVGLFSSMSNGTIRNLTVEASSKKVKGGNYTGIVIGYIGEGSLENVSAKGNVTANDWVGGVAGACMNYVNLQQVSYTGQVTATGIVGGITGFFGSGKVAGCESKNVTVRSTEGLYVGGLIGWSDSSIASSKVTGTITRTGTSEGAFVGGLSSSSLGVTQCSADVTVSNASVNGLTAGLVADAGTIDECLSAGSVTSTGTGAYTGGLVAKSKSMISDSYSKANVTGTLYTAGLVAYNYGFVRNCYASGNVSSNMYGSGLVGYNDGSNADVHRSIARGTKVEVSDQSGWGLRVIGGYKNGAPDPSEDNYAWAGMQVSLNGVPKQVQDNILDGYSKSDAEIINQATYQSIGFDFNAKWSMPTDGYPVLQWEEQEAAPVVTKGDLNNDGSVSISDVVLIIDVIAGTITDANQVAAADVNGDGDVSITDCVAAIDLIAAQSGAGSRMAMPKNVTAMTTDNNDYISASLCDGELSVALNNDHRYTAFQMLVTMPEGMTFGRGMIDEMRGAGHQLAVRPLGNGQYLLAGFSLDNEELSGSHGRLFTVATSGESTGCITISDVRFADVRAEEFSLRDLTVTDTATGISETGISVMGESNYFDLQGRRVERPTKGLYIMNGKKMYHK